MARTCRNCNTPVPPAASECPECSGSVERETDVWIPAGVGRPSMLLGVGTLFADRYRIDGVVGTGGCGVVYRAFDRMLEQTVALKVLRSGASERELGRFRREVALAQRLSHPGVVRVFDIGRAGDYDYFTMELVNGPNLADRIRRDGLLPEKEARRLLFEITDALGYLHSLGIIHRDIKPANILIDEDNQRFLLGDFSLARLTASSDESQTEIVGTPHYMAPEQLMGHRPNVRNDLYALGATLFEALTGRKTHDGSSGPEIALKKTRRPPPSLRSVAPHAPPDLAAVIDGCLQRKPSARFASVEELVATFHAYQSGGPLRVPFGSLRRTLARFGSPLAAVAALVVIGTVVLAWSTRTLAVEVRVEGNHVVAQNLWGGTAWTVAGRGGELSAGKGSRRPHHRTVFNVVEHDPHPLSALVIRRAIFTPRGRTIFDTADMDPIVNPSHDPRSEFSGALHAELMSWSGGYGAENRGLIPVKVVNYPWYFTLFGLCRSGGTLGHAFCSTGRVYAVAAEDRNNTEPRLALLAGNNELLHMSAFALLPLAGPRGWSPPRMVEQADSRSALISYSLCPLNETALGGASLTPLPGGSWRVCCRNGECETFDREGNRAALLAAAPNIDPLTLRRERMAFFEALSQVDASRRAGALEVAETHYTSLASNPPRDPLEVAALHWIGAKVASDRADLKSVVRRTNACAVLWPETADPDLLRAQARILAGDHAQARHDLNLAQAKRGSTADDVRLLQIASALLAGDHSTAARLSETVFYPYERARRRAFIRIAEGDPVGALRLLDPWTEYYVRDRIQLLRALALVDLGRTDEARQALRAEADRHGWLHEECSWITMAADLADGKPVAAERALSVLERASKRSQTELEIRLLLPRVRLEAARALVAAGRSGEAEPVLHLAIDDHSGVLVTEQAHRLLATIEHR